MGYDFTITAIIPATPEQVYEAWLDSRAHGAMTGGKAKQSHRVGDPVSAWDGYITGKNLALKPGKTIVQTWRTSEFTAAHPDSIVTVTLAKAPGGTLLTLKHEHVPNEQTAYEHNGWQDNYFTPMKAYFAQATKVASKKKATKMASKKIPAKKKVATKKATNVVPKKTATKKTAAKKAQRRNK